MKHYSQKSEKITRVIISIKNKKVQDSIFIDCDSVEDVAEWLRSILEPIAGIVDGDRVTVRAREYFTFPELIGRKSANGKEVSVSLFGATPEEVYDTIMQNME